MACFHSIEEQQAFDTVADAIKNRMKEILSDQIDRLDGHHQGDDYYVKLSDVLSKIDDYT